MNERRSLSDRGQPHQHTQLSRSRSAVAGGCAASPDSRDREGFLEEGEGRSGPAGLGRIASGCSVTFQAEELAYAKA